MAHKETVSRIDWVDFSKGICIILVVMMHSTLGVEKAFGETSWLHGFIEWARPFRMPDFFLIAGLFLSRRIDRPWRSYLDTKVVHFAYFYILWMSIWYVLKLPEFIAQTGLWQAMLRYPLSFVQPLGTLWFIYMLAVFFVVAKAVRNIPVPVVWAVAAVLHGISPETGIRVVDEFCSRFVFFYSGFVFAPHVFSLATFIEKQKTAAVLNGLVIWAVINAWAVTGGYAVKPVLSLILGYVGTGAVVAAGVLLVRTRLAEPIRYAGANSIVIFLSYFIFMAAARIVIMKSGLISDSGIVSLLVTAAGIVGPVLAFWAVRNTPFAFLYRRPERFKLKQNQEHSAVTQRAKMLPTAGDN